MAKTSGGLGKGINALFGDIPEVDEENAENSIQMIPIGSIDPNKNQPRKQFAPEALDQLAALRSSPASGATAPPGWRSWRRFRPSSATSRRSAAWRCP